MRLLALGFLAGLLIGGLAVYLMQQTAQPPTPSTTTISTTLTLMETSTTTYTATILTTQSFTTTEFRQDVISETCFSRTSRCDTILASLIDRAVERVHVAVYSFTSDLLAEALMRARDRGVEVLVVVEEDQASVQGAEYLRLLNAGVNIRLDSNPYLMHHKFMVVDRDVVVTGSYNWSVSAEDRNDENFVVIISEHVNRLFEEEFQRLWRMAQQG